MQLAWSVLEGDAIAVFREKELPVCEAILAFKARRYVVERGFDRLVIADDQDLAVIKVMLELEQCPDQRAGLQLCDAVVPLGCRKGLGEEENRSRLSLLLLV